MTRETSETFLVTLDSDDLDDIIGVLRSTPDRYSDGRAAQLDRLIDQLLVAPAADYNTKFTALQADYNAKSSLLRADYNAKSAALIDDYTAKVTALDTGRAVK